MKKASIAETKADVSAPIDGLKSALPVLIADRGQFAPAPGSDDGSYAARIARLVREGLVRPAARCVLPPWLLTERPPRADPGVSAVDMVIAERREGR